MEQVSEWKAAKSIFKLLKSLFYWFFLLGVILILAYFNVESSESLSMWHMWDGKKSIALKDAGVRQSGSANGSKRVISWSSLGYPKLSRAY